jgi:hypothetical protein
MKRVCPVCGKELPEFQPCGKRFKSKTCSRSCGAILRCQNFESNWKRSDVQDRAHQTIKQNLQNKYGVSNIVNIPGVKEKIKQTNQQKYGVVSILLTDEVKSKSLTSRQSASVRAKMSKNSKLHEVHEIGVKAANSSEAKKKRMDTCKQKFGATSPLGSKMIRDKIKQTMHERYPAGSDARKNLILKTKNTCLTKYGVELGFFVKGYQSSGEAEVRNFIKSLGFSGNQSNKIVPGTQIDIYIPEKNFAIEYNGAYWHSDEIKHDKAYHWRRTKLCEKFGIILYHIYEWEWKNERTRNIIKFNLKNFLQDYSKGDFITELSLFKVDLISEKACSEFCAKNSLYDFKNSNIYLGLYYASELLQVFALKCIDIDEYAWEITINCKKLGSNFDGTSLIWKYFINNYNPKSIKVLVDANKPTNFNYTSLGMTQSPIEKLNFWYVDKKTFQVTQSAITASYLIFGAGYKNFEWKR